MALVTAYLSIAVRAQLPNGLGETTPSATGAISGVVIDAASGSPVEGAVVTPYNLGGRSANGLFPLLTDRKGRFVFHDLASSSDYRIIASHLGYFQGAYTAGGEISELGSRIALARGEWRNDVRIELQRPAAIQGVVVDELGAPVPQATVLAIQRLMIGDRYRLVVGPSGSTDDRGAFRVAGLVAGSYLLLVQPQGYAPTLSSELTTSEPRRLRAYPWTYYPGVKSNADAVALTLAYGSQDATVQVQLHPAPLYSIAGIVQTPSGIPGPDFVRLIADGDLSLGSAGFQATAPVENGRFQFFDVTAGHYSLLAGSSFAEYRTQPSSVAPAGQPVARVAGLSDYRSISLFSSPALETSFTNRGKNGRAWGRADVDLTGDVREVIVKMQTTGRMDGTVQWDGVPARLTASSTIIAEPADGDVSLGAPQAELLDGGTRFRIDGLMPGEYLLRFGNAKALVKSILWQGKEYSDEAFDASTTSDFSGVAVTLSTSGAKMTGAVYTRKGPIPADAVVLYFPARQEWRHRFGLRSARIGSATVTEGKFEISNVPAGDYYLVATRRTLNDASITPSMLDRLIPSATLVHAGWGGQVNQALEWSGSDPKE